MYVWYLLQELFGSAVPTKPSRRAAWIGGGIVCLCGVVLISWFAGSRKSIHGLTGTVSISGEPLAVGDITFDPEPGQGLQVRSSVISDGRFRISKDSGVRFGGRYIVRVLGYRPTGEKYENEDPALSAEILQQVVPANYNSDSTMVVTIDQAVVTSGIDIDVP